MNALVVFESGYGSTRQIAEAVADGLRGSIPTELMCVSDAHDVDLSTVRLLVVGGHGPAAREWLHQLPRHRSCRGVAFDTRFDKPTLLTGCAAKSIQRGLQAAGFSAFGEPHSFLVTGTAGPLTFGEIEPAREWGEAMGRMIVGMSDGMAMPVRANL
jgi:hypothetical protein